MISSFEEVREAGAVLAVRFRVVYSALDTCVITSFSGVAELPKEGIREVDDPEFIFRPGLPIRWKMHSFLFQ